MIQTSISEGGVLDAALDGSVWPLAFEEVVNDKSPLFPQSQQRDCQTIKLVDGTVEHAIRRRRGRLLLGDQHWRCFGLLFFLLSFPCQ